MERILPDPRLLIKWAATIALCYMLETVKGGTDRFTRPMADGGVFTKPVTISATFCDASVIETSL